MEQRLCGTCTKCCEGYLTGEALGHTFYPGKPCHFVVIGSGCSIYEKRPQEPCVSYKCLWVSNDELPEWMKPNEINVIIDKRITNGIEHIKVTEAGGALSTKVLSWLVQYVIKNNLNLSWEVDGEVHWIGSPEFNWAMMLN